MNRYASGVRFEGAFVRGKREGIGRMIFPNGPGVEPTILTGEWRDDKVHLDSLFHQLIVNVVLLNVWYSYRSVASINWCILMVNIMKDNYAKGKCMVLVHINMRMAINTLANGNLDFGSTPYLFACFGLVLISSSFVMSYSHGRGSMVFARTDAVGEEKYEGDWKQDRMNGIGKYYHADGSLYDGGWLDGRVWFAPPPSSPLTSHGHI
jgi:hypothetical protein